MAFHTLTLLINRPDVVAALSRMRREWQEIANRRSLVEVKTSVGFLFSEMVDAIELTPEERSQVLG